MIAPKEGWGRSCPYRAGHRPMEGRAAASTRRHGRAARQLAPREDGLVSPTGAFRPSTERSTVDGSEASVGPRNPPPPRSHVRPPVDRKPRNSARSRHVTRSYWVLGGESPVDQLALDAR